MCQKFVSWAADSPITPCPAVFCYSSCIYSSFEAITNGNYLRLISRYAPSEYFPDSRQARAFMSAFMRRVAGTN